MGDSDRAADAPLTSSEGDLALGHKGGYPAQMGDPDWYHGLVDEPSVYDRALTSAEVRATFERCQRPQATP